MSAWRPFRRDGKALYDFNPDGDFQVALHVGDRVEIYEESSGWYKGTVLGPRSERGIFPASYVELLPEHSADDSSVPFYKRKLENLAKSKQEMKEGAATTDQLPSSSSQKSLKSSSSATSLPAAQQEAKAAAANAAPLSPKASASPVASSKPSAHASPLENKALPESKTSKHQDSIVDEKSGFLNHNITAEALFKEISHCLQEWSEGLKGLLHGGLTSEYHRVKERMSSLLELRSKVTQETDSKKRDSLRDEIIQLIESSRKMQEGFMVPRNQAGHLADTHNTGVIELLNLHRQMDSTLKEESSSVWRQNAQRRRQSSMASQLTDDATERRSPFPPGNMQLFLDVKMSILAVGESTELYFSLYSADFKQFITEDFVVTLTDKGMPEDIQLINKLQTIFKDLSASDFSSKLHLVCFIYRRGRLVLDTTKKKTAERLYRRPYACSVLDLSTLSLENNMGKEINPPACLIYQSPQESQFPKLHEMIIEGDKSLTIPQHSKGIILGIALHHGSEEDVRARARLPVATVPATNKLDFPEIINPGEVRNDLYIILLNGSFLQDKKKSQKNVEVIIKVLDNNGNVIKNAIARGAGGCVKPIEEFSSSVYYHLNNPVWNEPLCLRIDPNIFEKCHIFFSLWHCSTNSKKSQPFAFAFMPITTATGAVVPDQEHQLTTYKLLSSMEEGKHDISYLHNAAESKLVSRKETITVRTKLCSTLKTQNEILHSLFNWRSLDLSRIGLYLEKFTTIKAGGLPELSRFVRSTFDVFFGLLSHDHYTELQDKIFKAILHCLGLLTDKKMKQYRPLVDSYVRDIFNSPTAHHIILKKCIAPLDEFKGNPDAHLMQIAKCLNYVIKLVVASRKLDMKQPKPSCDNAFFKANMMKMLAGVNRLLASNEEVKESRYLLPSQSYIVRGFPEIVDDLKEVFTARELGLLARDVIEAIPALDHTSINKLNLVRLLLAGDVGYDDQARAVVFPVVLKVLKKHLRSIDTKSLSEPYLCVAILQKLLTIVQNQENAMWEFRDILEDLIHVVIVVQKANLGEEILKPPSDTVKQFCKVDMLTDSTTVIWAVLHGMSAQQIDKYISGLSLEKNREFTSNLLLLMSNALKLQLFPELWIVVHMMQFSVITTMLERLSEPIRTTFGPKGKNYSHDIWRRYFELSLDLLANEGLRMEKFSNNKKEFILPRYGDVRVNIIKGLRTMWKALELEQVSFTYVLVARLFELAQHSESQDCITLALDIYFDMLRTEFIKTKQFATVERFTIDALYDIANKSQDSGDKFMKFIYENIKGRLDQSDKELKERGLAFLGHISKVYELMSSLLKFPDTALYEDERTSVALRLMKYLEDTGHSRKEMASRYVQYLVDLHLGLGNFVEAGMAQLYQIRLHDWTNEMMEAFMNHPAETERTRKERLYKLAVQFFSQGEAWERAIEMCQHLAEYYKAIYDYDNLSNILKEEAEYFQNIIHKERFYPNYFRVVYYGNGFDPELRDKEFVYRGVKLETLMAFTDRIRMKFPNAKILPSSDPPAPDVLASTPQIISITSLTREKADNELKTESKEETLQQKLHIEPPSNIAKYVQNTEINVFSYSKAVQKSKEKKPDNEFKDLWVNKTYIYTEESFPTNRRRVRVVNSKTTMLTPLENALVSMSTKTAELKERIEAVENTPGTVDLGPLSMILNGMIDAAVNGGTQKYISAFLCDEFTQTADATARAQQDKLRHYIRQQIELLKKGLDVFGSRCDNALRGLYEHLTEFYQQMITKTRNVI